MNKKIIFLIFTTFLAYTSCARTVTPKETKTTVSVEFKVQGSLKIRDDIGYYLLINAPSSTTNSIPLQDAPRVNGPVANAPTTSYEYKAPFLGKYPNDNYESKWTDFFYITKSPSNSFWVRQGYKKDNSSELDQIFLEQQEYQNTNTKFTSDNKGYKIEFELSRLHSKDVAKLININCNIAIGSSLENNINNFGQVYDYWKNNDPFSINLEKTNNYNEKKFIPPALKQIPSRPQFGIPNDMSRDDLTISEININVNVP